MKSINPLLALAIFGYLIAIIPSAIVPPSPHALHSIVGWPFLSIITGYSLFKADHYWKHILLVITVASLAFTGVYLRSYFLNYPKFSGPFFESHVKEMAVKADLTGNWNQFIKAHKQYNDLARRYFLMQYRKNNCRNSD